MKRPRLMVLPIAIVLVVAAAWPVEAAARRCANFGGEWEGAMSGRVRCSVAPSVIQRFSLVLPVSVRQRGCRFGYRDLFGDELQRGTIRGRSIRFRKPKVPLGLVNLFRIHIDDVRATGSGKVRRRGRATTRISARLTGEINGVHTSCSVKWTTNFVRRPTMLPPPPPPPPDTPPFDVPCCFFGRTVTADYHWPHLGTILYSSGIGAVSTQPGNLEFPNIAGQGIEVDFLEKSFRITYRDGWNFSTAPSTFDGLVISLLGFGNDPIIGVLLTDTNIPGYDGTQLSFDASHVFVNQLGFSGFPAGSFIDVNVIFRQ